MLFMAFATAGMASLYQERWFFISILSLISIWIAVKMSAEFQMLFGALLATWGSFLPWWCKGDLVSFCGRGIDFYMLYEKYTLNNIGLVVVGLSTIVILLSFRSLRFKQSGRLLVLCVLLLTSFVLFLSIVFSGERIAQLSMIGGISLDFGFMVMALGVFLQLSSVSRSQGVTKLWWSALVMLGVLPIWYILFHRIL